MVTDATNISAIVSLLLHPADLSEFTSAAQFEQLRATLLSLESWFSGLLVATTIAVLLGVFLEVFEIDHDVSEARHEIQSGNPDTFPRMKPWRKIAGGIGWAVVVIGLVGEFGAEWGTAVIGDCVEEVNETIIARAGLDARNAEKSAELSGSMVVGTLESLIFVSSAVSKAQASAGDAMVLAHDATTEAVSAKNDLVKVRADIARVEEKYAPRTLSANDRSILIRSLKYAPLHPDTPIDIESFIGASDGVSYGMALTNAINDPETGWHAKFRGQTANGGNLRGVVLLVHDRGSIPPWATYLQVALESVELVAEGVDSSSLTPGTVEIFVAPKN